MRRTVTILVSLLLLALAAPATANVPDSFTACGRDEPKGDCTTRVDVGYGETVYLKGKVQPSHTAFKAAVWHRYIFGEWQKVDTVGISDKGCMTYVWETRKADGGQDTPHLWEFRIKGHGDSSRVKVFVWLGE